MRRQNEESEDITKSLNTNFTLENGHLFEFMRRLEIIFQVSESVSQFGMYFILVFLKENVCIE